MFKCDDSFWDATLPLRDWTQVFSYRSPSYHLAVVFSEYVADSETGRVQLQELNLGNG